MLEACRWARPRQPTGLAALQLLWDTVLTAGPTGLLALANATEAPFTPPPGPLCRSCKWTPPPP